MNRPDALDRLVAGTVLAAFEGPSVPDWLRRLLEGGLAGVCLFDSNLQGGPRAAGIVADLRACRPDALLAVDEEGGDVTRLQTSVGCSVPGPAALGQADDEALTAAVGAQIGSRLAAVGIDLDFAPSVDVNADAANPVIGVRAFSDDPDVVARHGAAFVRGLQATGVAACAKHFPGHGATDQDSHVVLPRLRCSRDVLERRELPPFAAAIDAGVASVMTSHIVIEAIDADLPATLSPRVVTGLLRGELGWDGVVVSDALDMAGASGELGLAGAAVAALRAGCDLLCLGANLQEHEVLGVVAGLRAAVDDGRLDPDALEAAGARVAAMRPTEGAPVALDEELGRRAAAAALTIEGELRASLAGAYVLQLETRTSLAVGAVPWGVAEPLARLDPGSAHAIVAAGADPAGAARAALEAARGRPLVATVRDAHRHPAAWALLELLAEERPDLVVVEMGWPGGPPRPGACTIATRGASRASGEAVAELLAQRADGAAVSAADLLIAGGTVLRDGVAEAGDVAIAGGRVAAGAAPGSVVLDAAGLLVAPGLIDVQINGAAGVDLTYEPERWPEVAVFLPSTGVTSWCPTLITCPVESIARAQASVVGAVPDGAAAPLGLHLEGPMLSPAHRGAHPVEHQRLPDPALYADWSPATGVALVTIAPELPGAVAAIETLVGRGVAVSVGHSAAGPAEVAAAADAGARGVTHLFNAMGALHHRELGTVGAALAEDRLLCGLIADGLHVHPAVVRVAWDRLGPQRTVLVSDAVWALGAPAGPHRLGDTLVVADDNGVRTGDGRLAGSLLGLDDGLRTLLAAGASAADAVAAATATPAALLGLADRGHLRPGAVGDVVLLTPALEVVATVVRGRLAFHRDDVDDAVAARAAG